MGGGDKMVEAMARGQHFHVYLNNGLFGKLKKMIRLTVHASLLRFS